MLNALLLGARPGLVPGETPEDLQKCTSMMVALFKHVLQQLSCAEGDAEAAALTEEQAAQLVAVLNSHLGHLSSIPHLTDICEATLDAFLSDAPLAHHALDLLPMVLAGLGAAAAGPDDGLGGHASDYCTGVLTRVFDHPWTTAHLPSILSSLRALSLTPESLAKAVQRGATRARTADPQDLPAVVHQLLVLAGPVCRDLALTVSCGSVVSLHAN